MTDITPDTPVVSMSAEQMAALRAPFPPELIGKKPVLTCKACTQARGACQEHPKERCDECSNWISPRHIHLDFVGHADVTDRLLQVDPHWNWEPVAWAPDDLPLVRDGVLWIRLTVCGVTRLGVGDAGGKDGANALKEQIGDAIRNAAMRFGVALDLWRKEPVGPSVERGSRRAHGGGGDRHPSDDRDSAPPDDQPPADPASAARDTLRAVAERAGYALPDVGSAYHDTHGRGLRAETDAGRIAQFARELNDRMQTWQQAQVADARQLTDVKDD